MAEYEHLLANGSWDFCGGPEGHFSEITNSELYAPGRPMRRKLTTNTGFVATIKPETPNVRCQIVEVMGNGITIQLALSDIVNNFQTIGRKVHAIDLLKIHATPLASGQFTYVINAKVVLED